MVSRSRRRSRLRSDVERGVALAEDERGLPAGGQRPEGVPGVARDQADVAGIDARALARPSGRPRRRLVTPHGLVDAEARSKTSMIPARSSWRPEISSVLSVSVNSRKPWSRRRRSAAGTSGCGGIEANRSVSSAPSASLTVSPRVAASIRNTARADVGERHVDPGERQRLRIGDQPGEPQPQRGGVVEDAVERGRTSRGPAASR